MKSFISLLLLILFGPFIESLNVIPIVWPIYRVIQCHFHRLSHLSSYSMPFPLFVPSIESFNAIPIVPTGAVREKVAWKGAIAWVH